MLTIGAVVALAGSGAGVQSASATVTNVFRSPTGNIACRYYPYAQIVQCQTENDGFAVAVWRYGTSGRRVSYDRVPWNVFTLSYGQHWTAPGINCLSSITNMRCRTSLGHGFTISRDTYSTW